MKTTTVIGPSLINRLIASGDYIEKEPGIWVHKSKVPTKVVRKPVGCLFPMCACAGNRLGCAHEPYDLRRPWDGEQYDTQIPFDPFDEALGG